MATSGARLRLFRAKAESAHVLEHPMDEMSVSAHAYDRVIKVGHLSISCDDVIEAVQYRSLDWKRWV